MPDMPDHLHDLLASLSTGARRHAARDASARARLALACAGRVADATDEWARTAVAMKQGGAASLAEELATGPLGTLRLLLLTARAQKEIAIGGLPRVGRPPRISHVTTGGQPRTVDSASMIEVDVLPEAALFDPVIFRGHRATVRCANPGGLDAFGRSWRQEVGERPRSGGVAVVLGAGNVTGLAAADVICQIFEHGRAVLLKLHPLHATLESVLVAALAPLIEAGLLAIVTGGPEVAQAAVAAPLVTHVHLTGGQAAFDAIVWGGRDPHAAGAVPLLAKPITCELGNVTPWIIVPGRYSSAQLACQADTVAASIVNNTSFNCIATKLVVTCRSWRQREEFLALVGRRLASLPARPAWYSGSSNAWESIVGRPAPADGTLPWVFRTGLELKPDLALDEGQDRAWVAREWFVPVAAETAIDADDIEAFCTQAGRLVHGLPGSLAASVTLPATLPARDRQRAELLVEHLAYGVVGVNGWSAVAYAFGNVPWGGFPGATLARPVSGIGRVHDPLLLPLVHNTIVRMPLVVWPTPPWFPWHSGGATLARGLITLYASIARGGLGLGPLTRMLPEVLRSAIRPPARP
jgi:acyl-CoA reductase-like NAD-dependent aldehyde dehydrogenase